MELGGKIWVYPGNTLYEMSDYDIESKAWRIRNLYSIKDAETGLPIPFVPRPEQEEVLACLLAGHKRIIILKARQLGFSTLIGIYNVDEVLFCGGAQVSLVDKTQFDATKKLNNIMKFAFEHMDTLMRDKWLIEKSNDSMLEVRFAGDTLSAIYAGKNARGGTNQVLHISEWGVIQADEPLRSIEILTGALPTAERGVIIIETTWKGGKGGELWLIVKDAMEHPPEGPTDYKLFFFPWWHDVRYSRESTRAIEPEIIKYLDEMEGELGIIFTPGQRQWYAHERRRLGLYMFSEYPTTIDECFKSPVEGAIYADLIDKLRGKGAIKTYELDSTALVHTAWDLGSPINTVVWYFMIIGQEIRVIDCDSDMDITPVERVAHMLGKRYPLGWHYLPHDAAATQKSGKTFAAELQGIGLEHVRVVPQTVDIWIGINHLREIFPRVTFRLPMCERGVEALSLYQTKRETTGGSAVDIPFHNWTSHFADGLRTLAEAEMHGMIHSTGPRPAHLRPVVHSGIRDVPGKKPERPDPVKEWFEAPLKPKPKVIY